MSTAIKVTSLRKRCIQACKIKDNFLITRRLGCFFISQSKKNGKVLLMINNQRCWKVL